MNKINLKKTKIIATLGPSCNNKSTLFKMIQHGVNVIRINFSHANYQNIKQEIQYIKEINEEYGFTTAILADLQGPKLRIGSIKKDILLIPGHILTFTNNQFEENNENIYITYKEFPKDLKLGEKILIDDGKLVLKVIEISSDKKIKAQVIQGGYLKSKKGINLPNTKISLPALTQKDINDVIFSIQSGVDWIALSFVRHANDIKDLIKLIQNHSKSRIPIIAKIEKPEGVNNIDEILDYADGLMVARGDLGVEIPYEDVPLIQKKLIDKAKMHRKPVIVATQMLETMIHNITPTRAEVNDVANSVLDGADAVMLSGETSIGKYPIETIKTMTKIIKKIENDSHINIPLHLPNPNDKRYITNSICYAAVQVTKHAGVKAIVTLTKTGYTASQLSSYRPNAYIVAYTSKYHVIRMLSLIWGVYAFYYEPKKLNNDKTFIEVNLYTLNQGLINVGDYVINLNTIPENDVSRTNTLSLNTISNTNI